MAEQNELGGGSGGDLDVATSPQVPLTLEQMYERDILMRSIVGEVAKMVMQGDITSKNQLLKILGSKCAELQGFSVPGIDEDWRNLDSPIHALILVCSIVIPPEIRALLLGKLMEGKYGRLITELNPRFKKVCVREVVRSFREHVFLLCLIDPRNARGQVCWENRFEADKAALSVKQNHPSSGFRWQGADEDGVFDLLALLKRTCNPSDEDHKYFYFLFERGSQYVSSFQRMGEMDMIATRDLKFGSFDEFPENFLPE